MNQPATALPPLPPLALACPWCGCPSVPSPAVQSCVGCRRTFTLSAGPALDGAVVPAPFNPAARQIALKWSAVVAYRFARLEPPGITSGTLDPVLAVSAIEQTSIAYGDVVSIAVWRKLALVDIIVAILIPAPSALMCGWVAIVAVAKAGGVAAVFGAIAVVMGSVAVWLLRRGIVIGRRQARITGRWASSTVLFQSSAAFHEELFRRCGIARPPIP